MRVLVCGGRDYEDVVTVYRALDMENHLQGGFDILMQGGATGADEIARQWADEAGVQKVTFHYQRKAGKAGGPLRNAAMLQFGQPDLVIAFPGGKGTADMVARARAAYVPIREIYSEDDLQALRRQAGIEDAT